MIIFIFKLTKFRASTLMNICPNKEKLKEGQKNVHIWIQLQFRNQFDFLSQHIFPILSQYHFLVFFFLVKQFSNFGSHFQFQSWFFNGFRKLSWRCRGNANTFNIVAKKKLITSIFYFLYWNHSLIRGILIQSCSSGAKNFTNYVFCHVQFSGVIQNIENRCAILTPICLCRLVSK